MQRGRVVVAASGRPRTIMVAMPRFALRSSKAGDGAKAAVSATEAAVSAAGKKAKKALSRKAEGQQQEAAHRFFSGRWSSRWPRR